MYFLKRLRIKELAQYLFQDKQGTLLYLLVFGAILTLIRMLWLAYRRIQGL